MPCILLSIRLKLDYEQFDILTHTHACMYSQTDLPTEVINIFLLYWIRAMSKIFLKLYTKITSSNHLRKAFISVKLHTIVYVYSSEDVNDLHKRKLKKFIQHYFKEILCIAYKYFHRDNDYFVLLWKNQKTYYTEQREIKV